jgi:hypothetical protein
MLCERQGGRFTHRICFSFLLFGCAQDYRILPKSGPKTFAQIAKLVDAEKERLKDREADIAGNKGQGQDPLQPTNVESEEQGSMIVERTPLKGIRRSMVRGSPLAGLGQGVGVDGSKVTRGSEGESINPVTLCTSCGASPKNFS